GRVPDPVGGGPGRGAGQDDRPGSGRVTPDELLRSLTGPRWREIGRSVAARPIVADHIACAAGRLPPVLLFGAIHGNEPLGAHCLLRLDEELHAPGARAADRDVWIVPVANPDGFLVGRKTNEHDVD